MKLEVPNSRIMAGELAYLSPPAAKLLLTLIGCQDTESLLPIVTMSKPAIAKKCGYTTRQIFRLLTELEDQNWITRKGTIIIFHTMSLPMTRDVTNHDKALSGVEMSRSMTRDVTTHDIQMSHDPISTEEEEDQITIKDLIPIAEFYNWKNQQLNSLLKELNGKSKAKLKTLFIYMQRHEIEKPLAYLRKSMTNPGMDIFKAILSEMI